MARRPRVGPLPDRLARRRPDDGDLVAGPVRGVHPRQPGGLRSRCADPPFPRRQQVDVSGDRAIAQTKMTISQRATVEQHVCDVVCTGRFYDFFERRSGRWGLVLRQPIYEQDRLDPVDPASGSRWTRTCSRASRRAIATSPTCRRGSATRSSATCRGSPDPGWRSCIAADAAGSTAARPAELSLLRLHARRASVVPHDSSGSGSNRGPRSVPPPPASTTDRAIRQRRGGAPHGPPRLERERPAQRASPASRSRAAGRRAGRRFRRAVRRRLHRELDEAEHARRAARALGVILHR